MFNSIRYSINYFLIFQNPFKGNPILNKTTQKIYEIVNRLFDFLSNRFHSLPKKKTHFSANAHSKNSELIEKNKQSMDFTLKLPSVLWNHILSFLNSWDFTSARRANQALISDPLLKRQHLPSIAFGTGEWEYYFGHVQAPPLPESVFEMLKRPCPFSPGKKIAETHALVLMPQTVNGQPFDLKLLKELIRAKKGITLNIPEIGPDNEAIFSPPHSYWALMTRGVIPDSLGLGYAEIESQLLALHQETGIDYKMPRALEAAACSLMPFLRSEERLLPHTGGVSYRTFCQEREDEDLEDDHNLGDLLQLVAGGFTGKKFEISPSLFSTDQTTRGVAPVCRFEAPQK